MNIIFIGQLYLDGQIESFSAQGSRIDISAHTFQHALLNGIDMHDHSVNVISAPSVSHYPKMRKLRIGRAQQMSAGMHKHSISFINLPGIKHITKTISLRRQLKKILSDGKEYHIVVYGMHSPFLLGLLGIKKRHKSCLIVPDLPEYMSEKRNPLYRFAKMIDRKIINYTLGNIDSFILFSPLMTERIKVNKPYDVIEGLYQASSKQTKPAKERYTTVLYTGNLDSRYGIMTLLEAFHSIDDPNYRLWLCGDGNSVENIKQYEQNDGRIKYWGAISRDEVLELQQRATMLVNPRSSREEYTRYSFPSKTMEYLASGTPTIMAHLASIPKEYDPHIFYFEDESSDGLKQRILEVGSMPQTELYRFGAQASKFIIAEKNNHSQANKLISLLNAL